MFTGIVTAVGRIAEVRDLGASSAHGKQLVIEAPAGYLQDVGLGDSIALNGACMTATQIDAAAGRFAIDISAESLARTAGRNRTWPANLEKDLRPHDRPSRQQLSSNPLSHCPQPDSHPVGESLELRILAPRELAKYLAYKGSITVNGVSLTVNTVTDQAEGCEISINLIPHTVQNTALHALTAGAQVNLEIALIARYVERMLSALANQAPAAIK